MENKSQPVNTDGNGDRWALIRDVAVLQVKLIVDGVRDLLLVPISLLAGIVSLVKSDSSPGNEFYELMRLGKKTEHWINLFGAADQLPARDKNYVSFPDEDIDAIVSRVEMFVVDEYRKGGLTKQAKERLDKAIDSLHKLAPGKDRKKTSDA